MRELRTLLGASLALAVVGCASSDADVVPSGPSFNQSVQVDNSNRWEIWLPYTYLGGCTSAGYVAVSYRVHLHDQVKSYQDGRVLFTQRLNIAGGRLRDPAGNELHFTHHGDFIQLSRPDGSYVVRTTARFKVHGPAIQEGLVLEVEIEWDGVDLTVVSSSIVEC